MKLALSICGGGIRGIIPVMQLAALERQTGLRVNQIFNYVAGTSTGALLAAAIAAGIPASDLLTVYTTRSKDIFKPTGWLATARRAALGYIYEPTDLHKVLVDVFGNKADWTVNNSPIGILINATAMNGHNWYFVRDNAINRGTTGKVKLIDAAIASACAPTYHDHWKITMPDGKDVRFFDGGSGGLANPSYQAAVEMFAYDTYRWQNTRMLTLGTGYFPQSDDAPSGLLATIGWATSTLVDTAGDMVDDVVARMWPTMMKKINPQLPHAIDEADLKSIPELLQIGAVAAAALDWQELLKAWNPSLSD